MIPKSGRVPTTPDEGRSGAKKQWGEAEDLRATGAVESMRAATSKYNDNRNVATTLNDVGYIYVGLGLPQQALKFYEEPSCRVATPRKNENRGAPCTVGCPTCGGLHNRAA